MSSNNPREIIHVISHGKKWCIKKQSNKIATKIFKTKEDAINEAYGFPPHWRIVIHRKDGSIESVK